MNEVDHLVHATSVERGRAIAREGLKPGCADRCNYDAGRWLPLDGVYLSRSCMQTERYRRAHDLIDRFAIVLVEADPDLLLPDEDIVDSLLAAALEEAAETTVAALKRRWEDYGPPPDDDPLWTGVGRGFLRRADPGRTGALDPEDLSTLVSWWAELEFSPADEVDPFDWRDLKDRVVRALPRMDGRSLAERSRRHPGPIGFEGPVRIVCVAEATPDGVRILAGAPPADHDAATLLRVMLETVD